MVASDVKLELDNLITIQNKINSLQMRKADFQSQITNLQTLITGINQELQDNATYLATSKATLKTLVQGI